MGLSDGRNSFRIGLAVLIQYRSVTDTQPARHLAVAITLNAKASSLKIVIKSLRLMKEKQNHYVDSSLVFFVKS